mmetsp:Transcript_1314/g.1827  ORF Transcript_1314/g.1827 Transcript_1314/m.1827 type:complete len:85 (+) Transcript_1314:239-493(+)
MKRNFVHTKIYFGLFFPPPCIVPSAMSCFHKEKKREDTFQRKNQAELMIILGLKMGHQTGIRFSKKRIVELFGVGSVRVPSTFD